MSLSDARLRQFELYWNCDTTGKMPAMKGSEIGEMARELIALRKWKKDFLAAIEPFKDGEGYEVPARDWTAFGPKPGP